MRQCDPVYHYTDAMYVELQSNLLNVILHGMLSNDFVPTKRHLGIALSVFGFLAFLAIILIDVLDVGREGGIGPAQQIALVSAAALALLGLTLIPLGDQPA